MGNENQGPPGGSELKWLSHATGGCALPAENLTERRRHEKNPFLPSDPILFPTSATFFPSLPYLSRFLFLYFLFCFLRYAFPIALLIFVAFSVCCFLRGGGNIRRGWKRA